MPSRTSTPDGSAGSPPLPAQPSSQTGDDRALRGLTARCYLRARTAIEEHLMTATESALTGKVNAALEPLFVVPMTAPECIDRFADLGYERHDWWQRYF